MQSKCSVQMNNAKEIILRTSFKLFLQKSYKSVTLREIIKETGLSNGAFYHYFDNKEELFKEVVEMYWIDVTNIPIVKHQEVSLLFYIEQSLQRWNGISHFIEYEFEPDTYIDCYLFVSEAYRLFPELKEKSLRIQRKEIKNWTDVINMAKHKQEINIKIESNHLAEQFVFGAYGKFISISLSGNMSSVGNEVEKLWRELYTIVR